MRLFTILSLMLLAWSAGALEATPDAAKEAARIGGEAIRSYLNGGVVLSPADGKAVAGLLRQLDAAAGLGVGGVPLTPKPAPETGAVKPTIALFRKALKAPGVKYDPATNQLTVGYDFKTPEQLADWSFSEKPVLKGGVTVGVGASGESKVRFMDGKLSIRLTPSDSKGPLLKTSGGLYLARRSLQNIVLGKGDATALTGGYYFQGEINSMDMTIPPGVNGRIFLEDKRIVVDLSADGKALVEVTDDPGKTSLGKIAAPTTGVDKIGSVMLVGGLTGSGVVYREVTVTGTPDPAWVSALFDEMVAPAKVKPSLK